MFAPRTAFSGFSIDDLAKAMTYILKRWASFTRFLDDGRVCLSNNAAERALRGIALGRKTSVRQKNAPLTRDAGWSKPSVRVPR